MSKDSKSNTAQDDLKLQLLQNCWRPTSTYEFRSNRTSARCSHLSWLSPYSPWLSYSQSLKGALCGYCVLFPQKVIREFQEVFIVKLFSNYKDFHEAARKHVNTAWYKASHEAATNFISVVEKKSTSR